MKLSDKQKKKPEGRVGIQTGLAEGGGGGGGGREWGVRADQPGLHEYTVPWP